MVVAAMGGHATASPASDPFVEAAHAALMAGRTQQALMLAEEAARLDPDDTRALFLQGAALNRDARPAEALDHLHRAETLGLPASFTAFETGWAHLQLHAYDAAIEAFETYEASHPGHAKTSELLGRAYLAKGDLERAETLLTQSIERDASLADTANLSLAQVHAARGERAAAQARLDEARRAAPPDSPLTDPLRGFTSQPAAVGSGLADDRRFRVALTLAAGYSSNVIALADEIALPSGISDQHSAFGSLVLDLAFDAVRTERNLVTLGYVFQGRMYESGLDEYDLLDQYFYVDWSHRLDDRFSTRLRLADEWTHIGGNEFRNQISARPALVTQVNEHLVAEVAYTYALNDYKFPTASALARDGDAHTVGLTLGFHVPGTRLSGRAGYSYTAHITDGSEFDRRDHAVFATLSHPLPMAFAISGSYLHTFSNYRNASTFGVTTDDREDDIDVVSITLSRWFDVPSLHRTRWFVTYEGIFNNSNVAVFDYDEHRVVSGITLNF
ncbi:MAG: tetratricopeptide repeat protein [Phycisphaeraceae bacterium]